MPYIGNQPFGKTVRTTTSETLTTVKTVFSPTGGYTVGYVDVYLNGVRLTEGDDFTATNGTTVTLQFNPLISDTVDIVSYGTVEMANAVRREGDTLTGTLNTQALVPTTNVTYDIGTSTMRYRDLYLSGNTIYVGDAVLNANGTSFSVANSTGGVYTSALGNTTITGTANVSGTLTVGNTVVNGTANVSGILSISNNVFIGLSGTTPISPGGQLAYYEAGQQYITLAGYNECLKFVAYRLSNTDSYGVGVSNSLLELHSAGAVGFFVGGTNPKTAVARINSNGIGLSNTSPTSGIGIRFPAVQSGSSDANTLDDYEEGTFSPFSSGDVAARGISIPSGAFYVKIGRVVYIWFRFLFSNSGSSSPISGNMPFNSSTPTVDTSYSPFFLSVFPKSGSPSHMGFCYLDGSSSIFTFYTNNNAYSNLFWNSGCTEYTVIGAYRTDA